ncbi:hypothetical protein ACHAWF_012114 [Thalassiosira exigua]
MDCSTRRKKTILFIMMILCVALLGTVLMNHEAAEVERGAEVGTTIDHTASTINPNESPLITVNRNHSSFIASGYNVPSLVTVDDDDTYYCIRDSNHSSCCTSQQCTYVCKSTLLSTCCGNVNDLNGKSSNVYPLIITATPRSGTVFTSGLLTKLNIPVANDRQTPKRYGMVSWVHIFQGSYSELWWTKAKDLKRSKFRVVWHQVRDPLKTLTSMAFTEPLLKKQYVGYLKRHIDLTIDENVTESNKNKILIQRGLQFYVGWHSFIDSLNVPLLKLEDLVVDKNLTGLNALFASIDKPPPDPNHTKRLIDQQRRRRQRRNLVNHNQRKHRETLRWDELCGVDALLTLKFLALSQSYGYYTNMTAPDVCASHNEEK